MTELAINVSDADLTGSVHSDGGFLNQINELDLQVELSTPSMQGALAKLGISSAIQKPATLSSHLSLEQGAIQLRDTNLNLDGNRLLANLTIDGYRDRAARTTIAGDVRIAKLNLLELVADTQGSQDADAEISEKLLSDQPFPVGWIGLGDSDIALRIDDFHSTLFDVSNATLAVKTNNGVLTAGPFSGTVNEGTADLQLHVDTNTTPASFDVQLSLNAVDLSRAGLFKGTDKIDNAGGSDATLALTSQGDSLASLMANANAEAGINIENLLFKQGALRIFSSDVLDQLVEALNPFEKINAQTRFSCAAALFLIKGGKLTTPLGYAMEAKDFSITGNGRIDFSSETLDLEFTSNPKKGLGVGFNKLTSLVKLHGPLAAPKLSLNENGIVRFGATVAAGVASGGLSLLAEGLWDKRKANSDVCGAALGN